MNPCISFEGIQAEKERIPFNFYVFMAQAYDDEGLTEKSRRLLEGPRKPSKIGLKGLFWVFRAVIKFGL